MTVDVAVVVDAQSIILIERAKPPFMDLQVLPGGHVEALESFEEAAVRELSEEIGLGAVPCHLRRLMVLDSPGRDPRGDKVSIVFVIEVLSEALQMMCAGSDAKRIIVRRIAEIKEAEVGFDHWRVIQQLQQERSES